jgi:hypothetical protein
MSPRRARRATVCNHRGSFEPLFGFDVRSTTLTKHPPSFGQTTDLSPSVVAKHAYCGDSRRLLRRVPSRVQSTPSEVPFSRVRNIQDNRGQRNNVFVARAIRVNPVHHRSNEAYSYCLFEAPARTRLLASSGRAPAKKPPCFLGSCFLGLCSVSGISTFEAHPPRGARRSSTKDEGLVAKQTRAADHEGGLSLLRPHQRDSTGTRTASAPVLFDRACICSLAPT